jgi:fatty-acyl-CoA synthase
MRGIALDAQLARMARQTPQARAFKFNGEERSYAALDERVTRLANTLIARGFEKGDRLAIMMHNSLELIECRSRGNAARRPPKRGQSHHLRQR